MFKAGVGTSILADAKAAGLEAAQKAAQGLDAVKMAYVYASCDYDLEAMMGGIKEALPGIPLIGNTSFTGVITQEGFVGPKLLNGMSLIGIGDPSEIVLNGYLDTTEWAKKYRDQISTLNLQGTSSIENLTVIATNIRYCVHDDWQNQGAKSLKRLVKNCIFRGYDIAYNPLFEFKVDKIEWRWLSEKCGVL